MKTGRLQSEGGPDYNVQLWIDVGDYGHMPDAQMFNASQLKECLEDNIIAFPTADPLLNDDIQTPFFILVDDVFELCTYLMKP